MHRTNKYSQHRWITWSVWLNGWVFVSELSGCRFGASCNHLKFRFRASFQQGVPWYSDNHRVLIHSETSTLHDKIIQSNALYRQLLTTQLNHQASLAKWLSVRFYKLSGYGLKSSNSHLHFRFRACFEKEVLRHSGNNREWIHSEIVHDMIRTYSQMYHTGKYSQRTSIIWAVWLNGWLFVY